MFPPLVHIQFARIAKGPLVRLIRHVFVSEIGLKVTFAGFWCEDKNSGPELWREAGVHQAILLIYPSGRYCTLAGFQRTNCSP